MTCDRYHRVGIVGTLLAALLCPPVVAQTSDPHKLIAEADRLAWLRVWTRAEPLYAKAREEFIAHGDERNALYAEVSRLGESRPRRTWTGRFSARRHQHRRRESRASDQGRRNER